MPSAFAVSGSTSWRDNHVDLTDAYWANPVEPKERAAEAFLQISTQQLPVREQLRRKAMHYQFDAATACEKGDEDLQQARQLGAAFEDIRFDLLSSLLLHECFYSDSSKIQAHFEDLRGLADRLGDPLRHYYVAALSAGRMLSERRYVESARQYALAADLAYSEQQRAEAEVWMAQALLLARPTEEGARRQAREVLTRALGRIDSGRYPWLSMLAVGIAGRIDLDSKDHGAAIRTLGPPLRKLWAEPWVQKEPNFVTLNCYLAMGYNQASLPRKAIETLDAVINLKVGVRAVRRCLAQQYFLAYAAVGDAEALRRAQRWLSEARSLIAEQKEPASVQERQAGYESRYYELIGDLRQALDAREREIAARSERERLSSERMRVELQEQLNVAAKERENAELKSKASVEAAQRRVWSVAFVVALVGVLGAGAALALAVRRGRRLAKLSIELAERNGELEQRSATRIRLLAAACHDLRQPAHALGLLAELGSDAQREPSRFVAWLQSVRRSTASLGDMLDELMDLGRLDGGHYTPQLSDVSLAELLQEVMLHFGSLAKRKGLTLEVPPADGVVVSDRHLLRRILFNAVSNGIKYTDTGFVRVNVQPDGDAVQLTVQDSGPGIPPDKLDDVFRDYVRLNPSKASEGLGIGLSIVRRAAELLGHGLTLASQPGQGTTVTLRLRRSEAPQAADAPATVEDAGVAQGVLALLEDDADVRDAMAALLRLRGYTVYAGPSAAAVLAQLQESQFKPQLVITDLHLEGGDGLDELAQLRDALASPHLPALLVTGDLDAAIATQAAQAGVFVAHKPLAPRKLAALVKDMLHAPVGVVDSPRVLAT